MLTLVTCVGSFCHVRGSEDLTAAIDWKAWTS